MCLSRKWLIFLFVLSGCLLAGIVMGGHHLTVFCHAAWLENTFETKKVLFKPDDRKTKMVALTFDDGPKAGVTDWLLEELYKRDVKATFFLIGNQVEMDNNDVIVRRMYEDGHQIGCHTYSHVQMTLLSETEQKQEILEWYDTISGVIGDFSYCIRPPYGSVNSELCACLDIPIILWSVDTRDWTGKQASDIADYIVSEAEDGDIILLHDIFEESVHGAVAAVDRLKELGYDFVTVDELLTEKGIAEEGGKVYRKAVCR